MKRIGKKHIKTCEQCGQPCKTRYCPSCRQVVRWKKRRKELIQELFTARIERDLHRYQIEVKEQDVLNLFQKGQGVYLYGTPGTGKTLYACSLLLEALKQDPTQKGLFIGMTSLLYQMRASLQEQGGEIALIDKYSTVPILVLDDIGAAKASEWVTQVTYSIINTRYESLMPTIITSNLGLDELSSQLKDDRISSRIIGMCAVRKFDTEDKRIGRK